MRRDPPQDVLEVLERRVSHDVFSERSGIVVAVALTSQEPRASFRSRWKAEPTD
jgi:hypothetical protein